ncbi:MAG: hypothetical protein ABWX84_10115 [Nocardioides sp.]
MYSSSTLYTVGTLLSRAKDAAMPVRVLVEGNWLDGVPLNSDGHGVLLDSGHGQFLVRLESISVVAFDPAPRTNESPVPAPRVPDLALA